MSSVKVKATIVEDNTGVKSQIPILLTDQGEVGSVTDYVLKLEAEGLSGSSMNAFIRAVQLLLEYMEHITKTQSNSNKRNSFLSTLLATN